MLNIFSILFIAWRVVQLSKQKQEVQRDLMENKENSNEDVETSVSKSQRKFLKRSSLVFGMACGIFGLVFSILGEGDWIATLFMTTVSLGAGSFICGLILAIYFGWKRKREKAKKVQPRKKSSSLVLGELKKELESQQSNLKNAVKRKSYTAANEHYMAIKHTESALMDSVKQHSDETGKDVENVREEYDVGDNVIVPYSEQSKKKEIVKKKLKTLKTEFGITTSEISQMKSEIDHWENMETNEDDVLMLFYSRHEELKKQISIYNESLKKLEAECIDLHIYEVASLVHVERKRVLREHPSEFSEEDKQEIMEPKPDSNNENIGKGAAMAGAAVAAAAASFAFTGNNA